MTYNQKKNIYIVIPCYNEEAVLPETSRQLKAIMQDMIDRQIICVANLNCILSIRIWFRLIICMDES